MFRLLLGTVFLGLIFGLVFGLWTGDWSYFREYLFGLAVFLVALAIYAIVSWFIVQFVRKVAARCERSKMTRDVGDGT